MTPEEKAKKKEEIRNCPEEWDFRYLPLNRLHIAIYYEYAREVEWIRREFDQWHRQRITLERGSEHYAKWDQRTVGEILDAAAEAEPNPDQAVPPEIQQEALNSQTWAYAGDSGIPLEFLICSTLLEMSPYFPRPFKQITVRNPKDFQDLIEPWRKKLPAFQPLDSLRALTPQQIAVSASAGVHYAKIDLRMGTAQVRKQLEKQFKAWRKKYPGVQIPPRGKGTTLPISKMRDLAAYRLSNGCWSAATARNEIFGEYDEAERKKDDPHSFLPIFEEDSGEWSRAVKRVKKKTLKSMFPSLPKNLG